MLSIISTVIFAFIAGIAFKLFLWVFRHLLLHISMSDIPGPKCLPFIGVALKLVRESPDGLHDWFMNECMKYKEGICLFWIGTEPVVNIRKPEHIEAVLTNTKYIKKSNTYEMSKPWLGNGLITSTGEIWSRNRRLLTPSFHLSILRTFFSSMSEKAEILTECIKERIDKNPGIPVNIYELTTRCTLDIICETAMGVSQDVLRKPKNSYFEAIARFGQLAIDRTVRPWARFDFIYNRTGAGKESQRCVKTLHDFGMKVIKDKQASLNIRKKDDFGNQKLKAFVDLMMEMNFSAQEIREQVDALLFGGHDTTSAAASWCLFALGNHPDIQKKVHAEITRIFAGSKNPATLAQLAELKYLDRVVKETLRMYAIVPIIGRHLERNLVLENKYTVLKGSTVLIHIYQLHKDPEIWENPDVFQPDRFLPKNLEKLPPYSYIPFSVGPRNCIGQKFALMELKTILTAILRKWKVTSCKKDSEMKTAGHLVTKPKNNSIELYFEPYN